MKIVTYNVNSLRARFPYLNLFLDSEVPDIVCLQELKATSEQIESHIDSSPKEVLLSLYMVSLVGTVCWWPQISIEHGARLTESISKGFNRRRPCANGWSSFGEFVLSSRPIG